MNPIRDDELSVARLPKGKGVTAAGFSLFELLIVLVIAGILVGIAVPGFVDSIRNNRLTTCANDLVTALNIARSEAIKRGVQVVVRTKGSATQWESGWDVFVDNNGDFLNNGTDTLIRTYGALPGGYTLRTSNATTYQLYAAYLPNGLSTTAGGAGDVFSLCSKSGTMPRQREIAVSSTGRPRVDTKDLTCP